MELMAGKKTLKFQKTTAGSVDKIREETSRGTGFGNMLWIKDGDSKSIRILAEPKDWIKYKLVRYKPLQAKGKLPTYAGWDDDYPEVAEDAQVRSAHVIPVATIDDKGKLDRIMFWEPSNKLVKDLLAHFDRRRTVMDRDWDVVREGKNLDTTYTLIPDDPTDRTAKELAALKELDFDDELVRMVEEFASAYAKFTGEEPEEEEEEAPAKPSKKSRVVEDDEEEEETEPEAEEEEEEEPNEHPDLDELDIDELKALAKKEGVKVAKGSKSPTYRRELAAHFSGGSAEPEAEDEGGEAADGEAVYAIEDIDLRSYTATLVDGEGEAREVYFDRQRHELDDIEEGAHLSVTIETDPDDDFIVTSDIKVVKKSK